jgi:lipopolysaccharide/colanic/teichoic acid biosynthesis glycosyltransferase
VTSDDDKRITRVGSRLRKWKLDELPQLINVVAGDMSLVGPRPEVETYVAHWPQDLRPVVLSVRPGITDPASVEFFDEAQILAQSPDIERDYVEQILPRKVLAYARYVHTRSFLGDLVILATTLQRLIGPRNRPPVAEGGYSDGLDARGFRNSSKHPPARDAESR